MVLSPAVVVGAVRVACSTHTAWRQEPRHQSTTEPTARACKKRGSERTQQVVFQSVV